jgi:hypothetical protein
VISADVDFTLKTQKPRDAFNDCRFSRSVWAEQNGNLSITDTEAEIVVCHQLAVSFGYMVYLKHRFISPLK